jgi:hypothetical protein
VDDVQPAAISLARLFRVFLYLSATSFGGGVVAYLREHLAAKSGSTRITFCPPPRARSRRSAFFFTAVPFLKGFGCNAIKRARRTTILSTSHYRWDRPWSPFDWHGASNASMVAEFAYSAIRALQLIV